MPPQASFVLFERSGGRARRPWRTSACFLLPTGSRPGIGTYARNAMTCRRGSRLGRELARWRTVGETGLKSLGFPRAAVNRLPYVNTIEHSFSSSPPSNRACGSPAHGSPTPFTDGVRRQEPARQSSGWVRRRVH